MINDEKAAIDKAFNHRYLVTADSFFNGMFYATDTVTNEQVGICKLCNIFNIFERDLAIDFRNIKISKHLHHENNLNILDIKTSDDFKDFKSFFYVTEPMESNLYQVISSSQALTEEHRKYLIYQILRYLKYIHSANLLHLYLSPQKLQVNSNCDLKVSGFLFETRPDNYDVHQYHAPEQFFAKDKCCPTTDVWSVGCIFYELIMREKLFPGKSNFNQIETINQKLGHPDSEYISSIKNKNGREFLESLPKTDEINWNDVVKNGSENEIDLIKKMLIWEPSKRISVDEALSHPYLASFHDPSDEPVTSPIENLDFSFGDMSLDEVKKMYWNEFENFNK